MSSASDFVRAFRLSGDCQFIRDGRVDTLLPLDSDIDVGIRTTSADGVARIVHLEFASKDEARAFIAECENQDYLLLTHSDGRVALAWRVEIPGGVSAWCPLPTYGGWAVHDDADNLAMLSAIPVSSADSVRREVERMTVAESDGDFDSLFSQAKAMAILAPTFEIVTDRAHSVSETTVSTSNVTDLEHVADRRHVEVSVENVVDRRHEELPRHNDAWIHGDINAVNLALNLELSFGENRRADRWPAQTIPVGGLVNLLSVHSVGEKDGRAFLQGAAIQGERKKTALRSMAVMGLDVDCGVSIASISRTLTESGIFAILHTTHSHLGTITEISQNKFVTWAKKEKKAADATPANIGAFLREVRGYHDGIVDSVTAVRAEHTPEGIKYFASHGPIPKFRVIFVLEKPFVFTEFRGSHQEAMKKWSQKLIGLAEQFGLPIDESCLDPSRLFYLPRHAKDSSGEIHVFAGKFLRFDDILDGGKRAILADPFAAAADAMGADVGERAHDPRGIMTPGGVDMIGWVRDRGVGFEIATVFRDHAPDRIRDDKTSKIEVECPFDGEHSNPGDPEDRACFVSNASDGNEHGFAYKCMHASCATRGRAQMLCESIKLGWLPEEVLFDEDYQCVEIVPPGAEPAPPTVTDTLEICRREIETFTTTTDTRTIDRALRVLAESAVGATEAERLIAVIAKKAKVQKLILAKEFSRLRKEARRDLSAEDLMKKAGVRPRPGTTPIMLGIDDEYTCLDKTKEILARVNDSDPRLFRFNETSYRCVLRGDGMLFDKVNENAIADELIRCVTYVDNSENGAKAVLPPKRFCDLVMAATDFPLPKLRGFARMPFLSEDWEIVSTPGYHNNSGIILNPPSDIDLPRVPSAPTKAELAAAVERLRHVFGDFPFDDGGYGQNDGSSSYAHLLALILGILARPAISGPVPMFCVLKPAAGTGGTLLAKVALMIATGSMPSSATETSAEDERRKNITANLMKGKPYFWLDNVKGMLDSAAYANLVTASVWEDRELGASRIVELPNKIVFVVTGNNPKMSHELARRGLPIRIDAKTTPTDRTDFEIENLEEYVSQHRTELAGAALTLISSWLAAGRPMWRGKGLASFESFCGIVGGILENAGIGGFMANVGLVQSGANEERAGWEALISSWYSRSDWMTSVAITNPELDTGSLASLFHEATDPPSIPGIRGRGGDDTALRLRNAVAAKADNVFTIEDETTGKQIKLAVRVEKTKRGGKGFRLERVT